MPNDTDFRSAAQWQAPRLTRLGGADDSENGFDVAKDEATTSLVGVPAGPAS